MPPKKIRLPEKLPADYPDSLRLRTEVVIRTAAEKFKWQPRLLLDFCKEVLARLTPHFCTEVQAGRMEGPRALSHLQRVLDSLLIYNEHSDRIRDNLWQELKRSKEYATLIHDLAEAEKHPSRPPQSSGAGAATWDAIEISFLSDERVQIRNGTDIETRNYAELGFEDSRTGKPNQAWVTLRQLAVERGIIGPATTTRFAWPKVEKRIQEIRKVLRRHFGISSDPVPYVEGTGYQACFKIGVSPSFHT
jgi:hypothetical protein